MSHSHNGIISNRTAVHYRIVSDGHTFSDMDGIFQYSHNLFWFHHILLFRSVVIPLQLLFPKY
mgnify:CR=1 FL=1